MPCISPFYSSWPVVGICRICVRSSHFRKSEKANSLGSTFPNAVPMSTWRMHGQPRHENIEIYRLCNRNILYFMESCPNHMVVYDLSCPRFCGQWWAFYIVIVARSSWLGLQLWNIQPFERRRKRSNKWNSSIFWEPERSMPCCHFSKLRVNRFIESSVQERYHVAMSTQSKAGMIAQLQGRLLNGLRRTIWNHLLYL